MEIEIFAIALFIGLFANIDPCCGTTTVFWSSVLAGAPSPRDRYKAIGFGLGRAAVLASVGVAVGMVGWFVSIPIAMGFLLLAVIFAFVGFHELRKAFRSEANSCPAAFDRHGRSPYLNAALMLLPPPLVFIIFAFFDDLSSIAPIDGALFLGTAGIGLSLPLFVFALSPQTHRAFAARLGGGRVWPVKFIGAFILLGAILYVVFAFLALTGRMG